MNAVCCIATMNLPVGMLSALVPSMLGNIEQELILPATDC